MNFSVRLLVMGPAGSGKTTLGSALSQSLGAAFLDGDQLHPDHNIEKMRRGEPLTDVDRIPWLERIAAHLLSAVRSKRSIVLACSGLKRRYRDTIRAVDPAAKLAFLIAPRAVLEARVAARPCHFMPTTLVADQCDQLELPTPGENILMLDATAPLEVLKSQIHRWLEQEQFAGKLKRRRTALDPS